MIPRHLTIAVVVMLLVALGTGFYVWRIPRRGNIAQPITANAQPVAPPASGPTERITLYVAYDDSGSLRAQSASIPRPAGRQERAEELLRALLDIYLDKNSPHPLGAGSEIRDVYLVDPGLAVIDLNAAFANLHRSGVLVEELTVASFIETLSANIPGIIRIKILVEGNQRDSLAGHIDLTNFFDVAAVSQLAAQLQNAP
jgi:hypothetical protein